MKKQPSRAQQMISIMQKDDVAKPIEKKQESKEEPKSKEEKEELPF